LHGLGDAVAPDDRGPPGEQADDQPAGDGGDDDPRAGPQLGERRRRPVPAVEQRQAGDEPDEVEQGPGGAAAGEPEPGGARAEEGEATGISHCDGKLSQCDVHDANRGPGRGNLAPVRRRPTAMRSVHRATTARPAAATLAALLLAATLAACGDDGGDEGDRAAPADVVVLAADVERVEPGPDAPVAEVVAGIEAFGLRAERILAQDGGNTVLSPLSVATAFAMVSAGADEPTEAQIAGVFGFPEQDRLHEAMNALTAALDEADGGDPEAEVVLDRADALWAQAGFDVEPDYLDTLAEHYGAGVPTTDFEHDPDGARRAINAAVAEATRDRIEELMPEGTVTEDTRAVVVDALYLKAPWAHPFSSDGTPPAPFHRADGTTVEVPMMRDPALSARAATAPDHTAVELPYAGGQLAMLLVVPAEGVPLDQVLDGLGEGGLGAVAAGLAPATVDLTMPTWETGRALDLAPVLGQLGLVLPGGRLPGIAPDLEIATAVHGADITVDEEGTEAAAATAVGMDLTAAPAGE